jgi:hypothetical protein
MSSRDLQLILSRRKGGGKGRRKSMEPSGDRGLLGVAGDIGPTGKYDVSGVAT